MIRIILGFFLVSILISGIVCRSAVRYRVTLALALVLILALSSSGCAVIPAALEHDARACQAEAWTVEAMLECQRLYPAHVRSPSDWASQPVKQIEDIIQHKGHDHD